MKPIPPIPFSGTEIPEHIHPHDVRWYWEQAQKLDTSIRPKIAKKYSEAYKEAYKSSKNAISPEQDARVAANTRLRLYVERYASASHGAVKRPPRSKI